LAAGASAGDLIETVSFYVSSVLNAIPATAGAVTSAYLLDGSVTQAKLATNVAGNGPAFSAYQSISQSVSNSTETKITFNVEEFDTNNNFASSRFTPTVAGYYQINACVNFATGSRTIYGVIYKNGSVYKRGSQSGSAAASGQSSLVSSIVYFNGSTDYVEAYVFQGTGSSQTTFATSNSQYFQGFLARSA
jgi:hypothetical protein